MSHDQYFKHKLFFPHLTGIKQYKWISQIFFSSISLPILMKNIRFCALKLQIMYLKFYKTRKEGHYSPFFSSLGPLGPEKPMFIQCHKVCTPPFVTKTCISLFIKKTLFLHSSQKPSFLHFSQKPLFLRLSQNPLFLHLSQKSLFFHCPFQSLLSVTKFDVHHNVCCP